MFGLTTKIEIMKKLIFTLICVFFGVTSLFSQAFQGQAVYQSKTGFSIKLDSTKISPERIKRIKEMIKMRSEKTYNLTFDKTASIYKEQVKLAQPGMQSRFRFMGSSANNIYYKDIKQKIYANQTELFGKNFLVKDVLPKLSWKLGKESKMIGNYLCFKATAQKKLTEPAVRFRRSSRGAKPNNKNKSGNKPKDSLPKTVLVTAWYTPQIPISQGPKDFWGLPGLILEVSYSKTILLCTKIVLNPKDKKAIKIPTKGKEVSQAEYDKIIIKKMKEMQERYGGNRRRRGGGDFRVRINH